MIEMLIATVILSVGLLSLAGLMSKMDLTTHDSRYVNVAALLCSEKLEQLTAGTPSVAPEVKIPEGVHLVGSLTANQTAVIDGSTVAYYDEVTLSAINGSILETQLEPSGDYSYVKQTPEGGQPEQDTQNVAPPKDAGTTTFKRRWIIEDSVAGLPSQVRRITVKVEYPSHGDQPGKYQMSAVRNAEPAK